MNQPIKKLKDQLTALNELRPFVLNGTHLATGKPFQSFGNIRSRELLANWLIAAVGNLIVGSEELGLASDPSGSTDGALLHLSTETMTPTEHVVVFNHTGSEAASPLEQRIIAAIKKKVAKGGTAYAGGKCSSSCASIELPKRGIRTAWHNISSAARHLKRSGL